MFQAGKSGNPKGRPKGSPNKVTQKVRDMLWETVEGEIHKLPDHLSQLDAKERLDFLTKVLPYLTPKLGAVSMDLDDRNDAPSNRDLARMPTSELLERLDALSALEAQ
jgi:hypothetical protein